MKVVIRLGLLVCLGLVFSHFGGCSDDSGTSGCTGCVDNRDFKAEQAFYSKIDLGDHVRLGISGVSGDVSVIGAADSDSIIVSGTRRVRSESTEDAEAHLPLLVVNIQDAGSEVIVRTEQPSQAEGRSYEVDYEIIVPLDFDLVIYNTNGPVTVTHLTGVVEIGLINGQVVLDDVVGSTYVGLTNGEVDAEVTLPIEGTIDMDVVNGTIELEIPVDTSAEFSASVTNGKIEVAGNLDLQDLETGYVWVTGTLGDGEGDISLAVVNGNITVTGF
jgi:hypothetical protein